ncbi:hypothetical protein FH608_027220 [Nonomuraea phyllanthi]|uniref:Uncharacterized protein n=1 Tax=Nonomuraea phyllanthi TaxID=2219224 RepID=A0A5C4W712_9ACTN|nr:hypothetical protein [Nonomuraea phyllanthi]KAB8192359.1 hypothetical protein FH608_027220 [Nonomuraea phyllanthi]QFY11287.1 hypothetical protein GBF35_36080 [Nonomuraea phyllanthi]
MTDGFETRETWPFECLRCLHVWEEHFVVRHLTDVHGNEVEIWLSSGVAVPPPWSGACCPHCGAYHATSFPWGYLARHPELVAGPEPELVPGPAPAGVPAVAEPGRTSAPRTNLPGRLLIALGVPLALFVGYELYANAVAAAAHHR